MKPYFETKLGKLYNADCLEFMKDLPDKSIDLVLTDPPYGINMDRELHKKDGKYGYKDYGDTNWDVKPNKQCFELIKKISRTQIIWG